MQHLWCWGYFNVLASGEMLQQRFAAYLRAPSPPIQLVTYIREA